MTKLPIEVPASSEIVARISKGGLAEALRFNRETPRSLETLQKLALAVVARGDRDFERELRNVFVQEHDGR